MQNLNLPYSRGSRSLQETRSRRRETPFILTAGNAVAGGVVENPLAGRVRRPRLHDWSQQIRLAVTHGRNNLARGGAEDVHLRMDGLPYSTRERKRCSERVAGRDRGKF